MFFQQLQALMKNSTTIHISINKKNDKLTVSTSVDVDTREGDVHDLLIAIKPLNIRGTAEEIDKEFFSILQKPVTKINETITSNAEEVIASVDKVVEDNKPAPKKAATKPEEKKPAKADKTKEYNLLSEEVKKLVADRKWKEAKSSLEKMLVMKPENKHIKDDIAKCDKWIKSMESAGLFDEEKGTAEIQGEVKSEMTDEQEIFAESKIESDKQDFIDEKKAEEDLLNFEIPTL